MSRKSAVALLVATRRALITEIQEKPPYDTRHLDQLLSELERLLLDVRVGRIREFDLEYPRRVHVIVSS